LLIEASRRRRKKKIKRNFTAAFSERKKTKMNSQANEITGTPIEVSPRIDASNPQPQETNRIAPKTRRKRRFQVTQIDTNKISKRKAWIVEFHLNRDHFTFIPRPHLDGRKSERLTFTITPFLSDFDPSKIPSENNPRSHPTECLRSSVARSIEKTLRDKPEKFVELNRGGCIIADSFDYDAKEEIARLVITDPETQGLCDGATSATVIAKVQHELLFGRNLMDVPDEHMPEILQKAQWEIKIITGLHDKDFIAEIVEARNTSEQVKQFSIADFRGEFDWLKNIFEAEDSPVKGRIGWDENSRQKLSGLDLLALLNGMRRFYDERPPEPEDEEKKDEETPRIIAPTVSYSGKGKLVALLSDPDTCKSFTDLSPLALDIVMLYETMYSSFEEHYNRCHKNTKLGKRNGVISGKERDQKFHTPYLGAEVNYSISNGYLYPLLFAFRALISYGASGRAKAHWATDPKIFWAKYADKLIKTVIDTVVAEKSSVNRAAKKPSTYVTLHQLVENLFLKEKVPVETAA
jgi:hypothetical protein